MAVALTSDSDNISSAANSNRVERAPARMWPMLIASSVALVSVVVGVIAFVAISGRDNDGGMTHQLVIPKPYDVARVEGYLRTICDLGPRPSGSVAMTQQQALLSDFFSTTGGTVELQAFNSRNPETGTPVTMKNLIARWHPDRPKRYLLCAHYDTRPFPDRDPDNPTGRFVGANDGASGVAALMEISHQLTTLPPEIGVDIVLFDGEELVYKEPGVYFLGSTHFAQQYVASRPPQPYQAGILLDMVGDRELRIYYEQNSWNKARQVCKSVFETAAILKADAFVARVRHEVRDDHLPLNEIAKIPTIDLIDFDYPRPGIGAPKYWHTTKDIPEHCSGHSLATVVYVVHRWLLRQ